MKAHRGWTLVWTPFIFSVHLPNDQIPDALFPYFAQWFYAICVISILSLFFFFSVQLLQTFVNQTR